MTDANPAVASFTWRKDGSMIPGEASTYVISTVYRSHAGSYACGATNSVGSSDTSTAVQLEILCKLNMHITISVFRYIYDFFHIVRNLHIIIRHHFYKDNI